MGRLKGLGEQPSIHLLDHAVSCIADLAGIGLGQKPRYVTPNCRVLQQGREPAGVVRGLSVGKGDGLVSCQEQRMADDAL